MQTWFRAAFAFLSIPRRGAVSLLRFSSMIMKQIILTVLMSVSIDQFRARLHMEVEPKSNGKIRRLKHTTKTSISISIEVEERRSPTLPHAKYT
jgi:hypothetical protein